MGLLVLDCNIDLNWYGLIWIGKKTARAGFLQMCCIGMEQQGSLSVGAFRAYWMEGHINSNRE
eukprot:scaffold90687_cov17-Tisochrysis_lutea.AAC.1